MYAIVDIAGQQFKVEKKDKLFVHRLAGDEGSPVEFGNVLLIDNDGKVDVGTPVIKDAVIKAKILAHLKGDKVKVFKKKKRKGYRVLNGHRQYFTQILVEEILEKVEKKAEPKKEDKPATQTVTKAEETEKSQGTVPPQPSVKKETEEKTAEKKTTVTKPVSKQTTEAKPVTKKTTSTAKKAAPAKKAAASKTVTKTAAKPATKKTTTAKKPAAKKADDKEKKE